MMERESGTEAAEVRCAAVCVRREFQSPIRSGVLGFRFDIGGLEMVDVRFPP